MRLLNKPVLITLLAALAVAARAQDDTATFRSDTRLVVLYASVFDKGGKMVTTLPRDAFKVLENNAEQQIRVFRREDIPISLGIVVDNSGSMRTKRAKVEAASLALVKASNKQDEVFIVNFNDDAYLDQPFTNEIAKLEEGLARIDSKGGTAMRDAVSMSLDHLKAEGKKDKKVLLIITDGNDTASQGITLEKLVEKAHRNQDVVIYAIGLLAEEDKREATKAKRALNALTAASGGASYYPNELSEVEATTLKVANDIRNQYVIGYSPANQNLDGSFRTIKVVAGSGRYQVRTRTGYYATSDEKKKVAVSQTAPPQAK
jgi:Ca-activated chloride channel homolog